MKKLLILGQGSVFCLKKREYQNYKDSFVFLSSIESIRINGKEVSFEKVEFENIISCLGYQPGKTHLMWLINEETKGLFDLGIEYNLPDAEDYKIKVLHVREDPLLGSVFLLDIVNVNGEDIMSSERVSPEGVPSEDFEV